MNSLIALFLPGVAFCVGIALLWGNPKFAWLHHSSAYPWEFWAISICGMAATLGGVTDWVYPRLRLRIVGAKEQRYELFALAGGVPLFILMAVASLIEKPVLLLLPVFVVVLYMTVKILSC